MPENVVDDGAVLVHPMKAFILRHLPLPDRYQGNYWTEDGDFRGTHLYLSSSAGLESTYPEINDYILRLQEAVATLFGPMNFDLHTSRSYNAEGLPFHADHEDDNHLGDVLVRMATCIHNAGDNDRYLYFKRPDWSNHVEEFRLQIPAGRLLVFGGSLITDYTHGIPPSEEAVDYRSVITRFSLWRPEDPDLTTDLTDSKE